MSRKNIAQQAVEQNQETSLEVSTDYRGQFREAASAVIEAMNVPGGPPKETEHKDAIAENHERLQNAGLEDAAVIASRTMSSSPTATSGTKVGTSTSSKDQQAFEDQRVGDGISSGKKRRGKGRSTVIPDSIHVLVDLLENALSETQVQEVLEQAIEARSKGSALEISKNELNEIATAIFEEIRNSLANGDLSESGRERLQEEISNLFTAHSDLALEDDERQWLEGQKQAMREVSIGNGAASLAEPALYDLSTEVAHLVHEHVLTAPQGLSPQAQLSGLIASYSSRGFTGALQVTEQHGLETVVSSLVVAFDRVGDTTLTSEQRHELAREVLLQIVREELKGFTLDMAKEDLVSEVQGEAIATFEQHLMRSPFPEILSQESTIRSLALSEYEQQKKELSALVVKEVQGIQEKSERLLALNSRDIHSEKEVFSILLELNADGIQFLDEVLQEEHGCTLESQLESILGSERAKILINGLQTDNATYHAALAARCIEYRVDSSGQEQLGIASIAQSDDFVDRLTADRGGSIRAYESLFGDVKAPLEAYSTGDITRYHRAELVLLRDGDEALRHAISFSRYRDSQKGVIRQDPSLIAIDYAEELRKVPAELRQGVLIHLDQTLGTNAVQSLLESPKVKDSGAALYLAGVIEDDSAKQLTGKLRLAEQDIYFSYLDILALGHTAMQQGLASQVATHYREHFQQEFTLKRDHVTQTWILKHEDKHDVPEAVQAARVQLYESVSQDKAIATHDIMTVIGHEASLLGSEAARSFVARGELTDYEKQFFQKEKQDLIASASAFSESIALDSKVLERLITLRFQEALEEQKVSLIANTIREQAQLDRVDGRGVGPQDSAIETSNRENVKALLGKQGIYEESPLFVQLMSHYEKSYQHYDRVFKDMQRAAEELRSVSNDEEMVRFLARNEKITEDQFDALTQNQQTQRDWGYTKTELIILNKILAQAYDETDGAVEIAKDEFWTDRWKRKAAYALDIKYASNDAIAPRLSNSLVQEEYQSLLEKLEKRDVITEHALALKEIAVQPDSLFQIIEFAQEHRENLPQIIQRTEELFGTTIEQLLPENGNIRVVTDGNESSAFYSNDILQEILLARGELSPELQEKLMLVAKTHLSGITRQEAEERVGSVETRGLLQSARIRSGNSYRVADLVEERQAYIERFALVFGKEKAEILSSNVNEALREHVLNGTLRNAFALDRLAVTGDYLRIPIHKGQADQYEIGRILSEVFPSGEVSRWEERITNAREGLKADFMEEHKETWKNAEGAVFQIHEAMKGGFFGWGTSEEEIRAALRGLSPEERSFAIELYEVRHKETMLMHFREEMEGADLERALACYRGDVSFDDQCAIEDAVDSWFGKDRKVLAAVHDTIASLEESTRSELAEEAKRLLEEAERLRLSKDEAKKAESARVAIQAYQYEQAARGELRENALLQERVKKSLNEFFKECERATGLSYEMLLQKIDNAEQVEEVVLGIDDPDAAFARKLESSLKSRDVEEVSNLLQQERDRMRAEVLTLRLEFDDQGAVKHTHGPEGQLLIRGEEITAEHLQQFQLLQLLSAENSLIITLENNALSSEVEHSLRQQLKEIQSVREEVQQMSSQEFLSQVAEGKESLVAILNRMLTDESTGAPSEMLVSQFESFYTQTVLQPKYGYNQHLVKGTLFNEGTSLHMQWQERLSEIEKKFSDSTLTLSEHIETNIHNALDKKLLQAELSGNLDQIGACQLARAITSNDEDIITDALFPPELMQVIERQRNLIELYEAQEALSDDQKQELERMREENAKILKDRIDRLEVSYAELSPSLPYVARDMWRGVERLLGRATAELYRSALEKGECSDALKLKISMDGAGTNEELLFQALGDPTHGTSQKSVEQIVALAEEFCALEEREELKGKEAVQYLRECLHGELSGEEQWQADLLLVGVPETVAQMSEILTIHAKFEDSAWISTGAAWGRFEESKKAFDDILKEVTPAELKSMSEEELQLRLGAERYNELFVHFEAAANSADIGNQERRAFADLVVNTASTVGVVAGGILVTWGTAGLGTAGYLAAVGGSLVTVRTGLSYAMKGDSYSGSEAVMDTGMAVVDTASLGAGILISKGISKATTSIVNRVAPRQAARSAVSQTQGATLRLVSRAGEEVLEQTAERGLASKVGGMAWHATRATGRGALRTGAIAGEGAIQGASDGFLVGMYIQGADSNTWRNGFLAGMSGMLSSGVRMAGTGAVIGAFAAPAIIGVAKTASLGGGLAKKGWKKIRGKSDSSTPEITAHVDQVRAQREKIAERSQQQMREANNGNSGESAVDRHLSRSVDDTAVIHNLQDARNKVSQEVTEVSDEAIENFYRQLDADQAVTSGDALEREIHEAWSKADDEGFGDFVETGPTSTGPTPSRNAGPSSGGGSGRASSRSTVSSSQSPSPTRSPSPSGDAPQASRAGSNQGEAVATLERPQVKKEVELTPEQQIAFEEMAEQYERQVAQETAEAATVVPSKVKDTALSRNTPSTQKSSPKQNVQEIIEDSKQFVSEGSVAAKVESTPKPTRPKNQQELEEYLRKQREQNRGAVVEEPLRAPETTTPEVQPRIHPTEQPLVRPMETPQPMTSPKIDVQTQPLHRLFQQPNEELRAVTDTSPQVRQQRELAAKQRAKAKKQMRNRGGIGVSGEGVEVPYGLKWVEGERFAVIATAVRHDYKASPDILLRKRQVTKIKTFFGEFEYLSWSLPRY